MLAGLSFKRCLTYDSSVWVDIREINFLISKGIISVDETALKDFINGRETGYYEMMGNSSVENSSVEKCVRDFVGHDLSDRDRLIVHAVKAVLRGVEKDENKAICYQHSIRESGL